MDLKRKLVTEGLIKVDNSGFSNLVLSALIDSSSLNPQDKSFAAQLFYGTIERQITLDYVLKKHITKPLHKMDKEIVAILRSGLYQILYMESVPPHAAINQAVSLCPVFKKTSAKGLVNAVLRRCENFSFEKEKFKNDLERQSVTYSISKDIIELINQSYPNQTEEILAHSFDTPKLTVKINRVKTTSEEFKALLDQNKIIWEETGVEDCIAIKYRGSVTTVPGFKKGLFYVQGATSAYAVQAAEIKANKNILDLCAAPGGKSFAAAIALGNTGAVTSCDPNANRLKLIKDGAERLGITNITTVVNKGEEYNPQLGGKDVVICDVPCSGIGIIPKKPDLRYKSMADIERLYALQSQILNTGAKYVKLNGRLIYSTCTINKKENQDIIDKFLEENKNFALVKQNCPIKNAVNDNEKVTFLSHLTGFDGFFVAVLEKMW